jgi:hypothetical protein
MLRQAVAGLPSQRVPESDIHLAWREIQLFIRSSSRCFGLYFHGWECMKSLIRTLLLPAVLWCAPAKAAVQVYVSYIDNETRAVLTSLVDHDAGKSAILAIDGRGMEDGNIFSSNYGVSPVLTSLTGSGGEKIQAVQLSKTGPSAKNLAVVVLPSANGRNPDEMKSYLSATLKSLSVLPQASEANGGIQVVSFGTAGGVDPDGNPGSILPIKSSLFVGAASDGNGGQLATIRFAMLGVPPITLYSEHFTSQARAEAAAQKAFSAWAALRSLPPEESEALKNCAGFETQALPGYESWMAEAQGALVLTELKNKQTSVTTSFFGGPDFKRQANQLGLNNVNMEDSHLIDVLNANQIHGHLSRMISDPPVLDAAATKAMRNWYASASYPEKTYEDAIFWGLHGMDLRHIPGSAKWDVFSKFPDEQSKKWIDHQEIAGSKAPIDPFFYDVSRSFLSTAQSGNFLSDYVGKRGRLTESAQAQLNKLDESVAAKAQKIQGQWQTESEANVRASIKDLVSSLTSTPVTDEPLRSELKKNGFTTDASGAALLAPLAPSPSGGLKVWHSPDSDYSSISQTTDLLASRSPTDEQINRAIYVHVRTLGLPLAADENTQREEKWLDDQSVDEASPAATPPLLRTLRT